MENRLDFELVRRGVASSRERAKEYIKSGFVFVNGKCVTKSSAVVNDADSIEYRGEVMQYVGRGGLKLESALRNFALDVKGLSCADLGASTGGFTDCMLQNGAKKVYAVDVGHDQLADKLINNPDVINLEGVNVKDLTPKTLGTKVDFVASDLSFISCRFACDAASRILNDDGRAVLLIKPQFEVGKSGLSKGGIVKDRKLHIQTITALLGYFTECGMRPQNLIPSPITGGDGNIEYLVLLVKSDNLTSNPIDINGTVAKAFESSSTKR